MVTMLRSWQGFWRLCRDLWLQAEAMI
jgi:hypothetical protein